MSATCIKGHASTILTIFSGIQVFNVIESVYLYMHVSMCVLIIMRSLLLSKVIDQQNKSLLIIDPMGENKTTCQLIFKLWT